MREIKLGDKVRCKITGVEGIAVAKSEFINGCVQYMIQPKGKDKTKPPEELGIDKQSLEVITIKKNKIKKSNTGGAMRRGMVRRNY